MKYLKQWLAYRIISVILTQLTPIVFPICQAFYMCCLIWCSQYPDELSYYYYPHFTDQENEAQRLRNLPKVVSKWQSQDSNLSCLASEAVF